MKALSQLKVLFWDHGLFCDLAVRMSKDVKKVYYYVPNFDPWPKVQPTMIGYGLEGVETTQNPFSLLDEVDLHVFPDTGFGDIQCHLKGLGKAVWGSMMGEDLELDREMCKQVLDEAGLPVGQYQVVKGIKKLRQVLKEKKDQFVKISRYRGMGESFFSKDYHSSEPRLDKLQYDLGPLQELQEFDVEACLPDRIELGSDLYSVDGKLPDKALFGIEIKDAGYVGQVLELSNFPKPLQVVDRAFQSVLKDYDYRMSYSTECRIGKDKKPYMIDFTARYPNPPWGLYTVLYKNMSEIIWKGANGEMVNPETVADFGAILMLKSDWANKENWCPIDYDPKVRDFVRVANGCIINNQHYSIPLRFGLKEVGCVMGIGTSMEEAMKNCIDNSKKVGGVDIESDPLVFEDAQEEIDKAKSYGIELFT